MTIKIWAQWHGCCALAFLLMSADAVAQAQDGKIWTLESAMKKQKSAMKKQSEQSLVVTLSGDRNIQDVIGVVTDLSYAQSAHSVRQVLTAYTARLPFSSDHRHSSQPMLDVRAAEMLLSATPSFA